MFAVRQHLVVSLDVFQKVLAGVGIQVEPVGDADASGLATRVTKLSEAYGEF